MQNQDQSTFQASQSTNPAREQVVMRPNARVLALMAEMDRNPGNVIQYKSSAEFFKSLGI